MSDMLKPLTPLECDLRGLEYMPLLGNALFGSDFNSRATDAEWRAGITLWWAAWNQVPAASLPADDAALCRLADLGRDLKTWRKIKAGALHGFVACDDGRLYNPTLAKQALVAWDKRVKERERKANWRAKKTYVDADVPRDVPRDMTPPEQGHDATVPADVTRRKKERKKEDKTSPTSFILPRAEPSGVVVVVVEELSEAARLCLEAGGVSGSVPARFTEAVALVETWQKAGGDLETDILPAIREGVANGPESVGSLKFYDQRVRTRIAKRASGIKPAEPLKTAPPIEFNKPGELPELTQFRRLLADEIGPAAYRNWIDEVRIERNNEGAKMHAGTPFKADYIRDRYGVQVGLIARQTIAVEVEIAA